MAGPTWMTRRSCGLPPLSRLRPRALATHAKWCGFHGRCEPKGPRFFSECGGASAWSTRGDDGPSAHRSLLRWDRKPVQLVATSRLVAQVKDAPRQPRFQDTEPYRRLACRGKRERHSPCTIFACICSTCFLLAEIAEIWERTWIAATSSTVRWIASGVRGMTGVDVAASRCRATCAV